MKSKISSIAKNDVLEPAPRLKPAVVPSSGAANPLRPSVGTVILLETVLPVLAPLEAQTQSGILATIRNATIRNGFDRTLNFLKRLLSRIDLTNFPGSCCG